MGRWVGQQMNSYAGSLKETRMDGCKEGWTDMTNKHVGGQQRVHLHGNSTDHKLSRTSALVSSHFFFPVFHLDPNQKSLEGARVRILVELEKLKFASFQSVLVMSHRQKRFLGGIIFIVMLASAKTPGKIPKATACLCQDLFLSKALCLLRRTAFKETSSLQIPSSWAISS